MRSVHRVLLKQMLFKWVTETGDTDIWITQIIASHYLMVVE